MWATILPLQGQKIANETASLSLVKELMARSRPISFPLLYGSTLPPSIRKHLMANISRVDALRILNSELLEEMTGSKCPYLENLEYLSIDLSRSSQRGTNPAEPHRPARTAAFLTARNLRRVKIEDTHLPSLFLPWAQLTKVDINPCSTSAAECFDALRQCTAATDVCLITPCWDINASPSSPSYSLPRLQNFDLIFNNYAGRPEDARCENMSPMFRGLALPSLKILKIETWAYRWPAETHSDFLNFIRRAPHIEELEFRSDLDAQAVCEIIDLTPSLLELWFDRCPNAVADLLFDHLTHRTTQTPVAPRLTAFLVDYSANLDIDQTKLLAMIESRWSGTLRTLGEEERTRVSPWTSVFFRRRETDAPGPANDPWTMPFRARVTELKHLGLSIEIS
ncbi:F-box domain-containing protein [Mycena chlorophos]|uniref:F-box domain-containing protein n=1 Tax=Mycena chlorophos TaxID=658473 RepID=A0A8H6TKQ5_MYCCL|nr:F-box domain-containing protein [Mycena chlorophos]